MLMLRTSDGMLIAFEGTAPPLGVYEEGDARNHFALLNPGDLAVFYADGLTEATQDAGIGEQRLRMALLGPACLGSQDSAIALHGRIFGKTQCLDDVAILTLAREKAA